MEKNPHVDREVPGRYAPTMKLATGVTLSIGIGLLGASAPFWYPLPSPAAAATEVFQGFFAEGAWTPWNQAYARALRENEPLLILAVAETAACEEIAQTLKLAAVTNAPLRAALEPYVVTLLRVDGPDSERRVAADAGLDRAPLCVIAVATPDGIDVERGLPCLTGSVHEPFGFTAALLTPPDGEPRGLPEDPLAEARELRAMGRGEEARQLIEDALANEASPNGRVHRFARLEEAFRSAPLAGATAAGPADHEGPVEAELLLNDDKDILFIGWSSLASTFERRARLAAASPAQECLGVPRERWERRLRDATRLAWIGCPDDVVPAYGSLLVQRYLRAPADLDSLDRVFLQAVVRTMAKHVEPDGPLAPWLQDARASVESLR